MITYPTETTKNNTQQLKAIDINCLSKQYPLGRNIARSINTDFQGFWALKDISLTVNKGDIVGIIGRNGAGKTTLLNIIAGILSPTQGRVSVNGKVLVLLNLGTGFQDQLSGRENIFLNGAILGASRQELEEKLNSIIEFSELGDFINMPLGSYSQGMRLRLGFSIVANLEFDILVIDEILAVGDTLFQNKCFQRLVDFRRSGKTLIIISQGMDLIERLCDKAALLEHGHLLFYGNTKEGVDKYHSLLNTEKFFVGSQQRNINLVENTKKWSDAISIWGEKLGTKEVVIDSVELINKFGLRSNKIKTSDPLKIKVYFNAKERVKDPHFGVAIFRNDGVYCYGPNTAFDGHNIQELKPGKGYFILNFHKLLLAPGGYRISVAIWDKNETLAFDYHDGYYKLNVIGAPNLNNELLNIPFKFSRRSLIIFNKSNKVCPDLSFLSDKWGKQFEQENMRIESVKFFNHRGEGKGLFMTNETFKLSIKFNTLVNRDKNNYLWVGLYRDDGIYCQGLTRLFGRENVLEIFFPKLPLLPGGYRFSIGIWSASRREFLIYSHGIYPLKMVFDKRDHGTVYLRHEWSYAC